VKGGGELRGKGGRGGGGGEGGGGQRDKDKLKAEIAKLQDEVSGERGGDALPGVALRPLSVCLREREGGKGVCVCVCVCVCVSKCKYILCRQERRQILILKSGLDHTGEMVYMACILVCRCIRSRWPCGMRSKSSMPRTGDTNSRTHKP